MISRWSSLEEHWPQNSRKSFHLAMSMKRSTKLMVSDQFLKLFGSFIIKQNCKHEEHKFWSIQDRTRCSLFSSSAKTGLRYKYETRYRTATIMEEDALNQPTAAGWVDLLLLINDDLISYLLIPIQLCLILMRMYWLYWQIIGFF